MGHVEWFIIRKEKHSAQGIDFTWVELCVNWLLYPRAFGLVKLIHQTQFNSWTASDCQKIVFVQSCPLFSLRTKWYLFRRELQQLKTLRICAVKYTNYISDLHPE